MMEMLRIGSILWRGCRRYVDHDRGNVWFDADI
jgi:hypothetical protein